MGRSMTEQATKDRGAMMDFFELEWQQTKEQVWRNPLFASAVIFCGFAGYFSISLSGGFVWTEEILRFMGSMWNPFWGSQQPPPDSQQDQHIKLGSAASLATHNWVLALFGCALPAPAAFAVTYAWILHSKGDLGVRRLDSLLVWLWGASLWCCAGLFCLFYVASQWNPAACRKTEAAHEAACRSDNNVIFAHIICSAESWSECQLLVVSVYAYICMNLGSGCGLLLCMAALAQEQRLLKQRWTALNKTPAAADGCLAYVMTDNWRLWLSRTLLGGEKGERDPLL